MKNKFLFAEWACRLTIFSQALVLNVTPLLFVILQKSFGITTMELTSLVALIFIFQLFIDAFSSPIVDKIGYKKSAILSCASSILGLVLLSSVIHFLADKYLALLIATVFMAIGAGLMEVVVSPLSNSLPSADKNSGMCFLHSFYCWGHLFVIVFTTLFLFLVDNTYWYALPLIFALVPLLVIILLSVSHINEKKDLIKPEKTESPFKNKLFIVLLIMMVCAGGIEQAVAQWSSYFAEAGLGVTPEIGNLIGPAVFALFMGATRLYFGLKGEKFNPTKTVLYCGIGCVISFVIIVFAPHPIVSLIGCGLIGLFVGSLWPTVLTIATQTFPNGGTKLFAFISLFGDVGCVVGPMLVGSATSIVENTAFFMPFTNTPVESGLRLGLLLTLVLAVLITFCTTFLLSKQKNKKNL